MLEFVKGDIFDAPADIRVNTVNCVGVMGAGVALAFKQRYPDMFKDYQRDCKDGRVKPGMMHIWKSLGGDWIINFPTKRDWRESSRYEDIASGLEDLRKYLDGIGQVTVALPALGCGHGGLDWNRVSEMIRNKLDGVDAHVLVFEPSASRKTGRSAVAHPTEDERKGAEQLGYSLIESDEIPALETSSPLFVSGSLDVLTHNWIALLPSRSPGDRELQALRSIATELAQSGANKVVALVHGTRVSEEVAAIFLRQGVDTVLLLPFGVLTRKSIPKQIRKERTGSLTLVSLASANGKWTRQLFAQSMDMLRANAAATLLSDPEPDWLTSKGLGKWAQTPISYVRYETMPPYMRDALASVGARPIGRRGEDGAPNIDHLVDAFDGPPNKQRNAADALKQSRQVEMARQAPSAVEKRDAQKTAETVTMAGVSPPDESLPEEAGSPLLQSETVNAPAETGTTPTKATSAESEGGAADAPPSGNPIAKADADYCSSEPASDFYSLFLLRMRELTDRAPMNVEDIAARLELEKAQVNAWLKRGTSDGQIKKLSKPVRYQSASADQRQASFFVNER
ncbi:macro domain-containing protein [uncultured Paracoccus sp.]|uniref:macro domain-containing protein n=1 Tax=uncultured Paracoccus sp. TaxID=189685 RepID=UPI0026138039|nr:macro domain-containing protein [uncultured Paracoccus sp.]